MNKNQQPEYRAASAEHTTRREFLTRAAYASPVLLTLPAIPSFAQSGSGGGGVIDPTDCPARWNQFFVDRGFEGSEDFFGQVFDENQANGELTPETQALVDEFLVAFPEDLLCGFS